MARGRRIAGTRVRRELDMGRMALGLSMPGIDPRSWVEYGTVGTVGGTEKPDFTNGNAVLVTQDGIEVDVLVGISQTPMTCRHGTAYGGAVFVTPIYPGQHVLVLIPGGDLGNVGEILRVLGGPHTRLPIGEDRKPLFQNDRALLYAGEGVSLDLRTAGGARALLDPQGNVVLNEGDQGVARKGDTTKLTMSAQDVALLAAALLATGGFTPSGGPPGPGTEIVFADGEVTSASETVKAG